MARLLAVPIITRAGAIRLGLLTVVLIVLAGVCYRIMLSMPGDSYRGPLGTLTPYETSVRDALQADVQYLAEELGQRNIWRYDSLTAGADYIDNALTDAGYAVTRQGYMVKRQGCKVKDRVCENIVAEIRGAQQPDEIVVIGAHYDSVWASPGANDNISGVAALLALARAMAPPGTLASRVNIEASETSNTPTSPLRRTLRFVAFVNEESPFAMTPNMGSWVCAKQSKQRSENIVAMISLETMGYFSDIPGSQEYPQPLSWFYPSAGDFIGFISNVGSRRLVRRCIATFRQHARVPSEGAALPSSIRGVGHSDHWSFWQEGYEAIMVTDTAPYRYPYYHTPDDTPDKIDYDRLARVVVGLEPVIQDLVSGD